MTNDAKLLPQGVSILGSTGSIGGAALDVLARHPHRFRVHALSASTQVERLLEQCRRFRPRFAAMLDTDAAERLRRMLRAEKLDTDVLAGEAGLEALATDTATVTVIAAIVGAAGLKPTLAAVRAGKRVLLANKEPLVMCGALFVDEARRADATLLPLDSEHNAIFQCLTPPGVAPRRLFLTCSGGPFRHTRAQDLAAVTPAQACAHPVWSMGPKISVDSATLMNKGLEVIEACALFGVTPEQVDVVVHPQSIVHSLVEYDDGSVLAQMSHPDMRVPIAHALAWPERIDSGATSLDLTQLGRMEFEAPDRARFPCLDLAYEAARRRGTAPAVLNAANEVAVQSFLDGNLGFTGIASVIEQILRDAVIIDDPDLTQVLAADGAARTLCSEIIASRGPQRRQAAL